MYKVLIVIVVSTAFISCKKIKAKNLSGVYSCTVLSSQQNVNGYSSETIFLDEVEVTHEKKKLFLFEKEILEDSLKKSEFYKWEDSGINYQIKFVDDSLYFITYVSSPGGTSKSEYSGLKME